RAASSVEVTPETRFAPVPLCASRSRGERIAATSAAVVVLPLVPEITVEPAGSRRASAPRAAGSMVVRIFPGSVVPPPRPARRDRRPAARATAISRARRMAASLRGAYRCTAGLHLLQDTLAALGRGLANGSLRSMLFAEASARQTSISRDHQHRPGRA